MSASITSLDQLDSNGSYSYAEYMSWEFEEIVELYNGRIMRRPGSPTDRHQAVLGELNRVLYDQAKLQQCRLRLGPYDVRLPKPGTTADAAIYTVVQPDLCVICDPTKIETRGYLGAPDLIIEVVSPRTAARDWKDKFDLYEEASVVKYWIVLPQENDISVSVLDEATARYQLAGEYASPGAIPCRTLPGLELDWADIFADKPA